MTNYLEKFKNLQTEYPQCNLEIKTPNKNTKQSIIEGICNECSNKFEMQLLALGRHEVMCFSKDLYKPKNIFFQFTAVLVIYFSVHYDKHNFF